ncbi:MAG: ABC transporter substrate-binding protein, partial [bacterium]
ILLSMASKKEFGDSERFDDQLLTMSHPDAMNALLAGREVSSHFASPPYLFLESREKGIEKILSGKEAFGGEFTFIVGVSTEKFYQQQSDNYKLFSAALEEAIKFMQQNPAEAAALLADKYDLTEAEMREYLNWPGMRYTSEIKGLEKFISFMTAEGYLKENNYQADELIFEENKIKDIKESASLKGAARNEK